MINTNFSILKQVGIPLAESRVATHFALVTDTPIQSISLADLDQAADSLKTGKLLPVGGVEFTRKAMLLAGIDEPPNFTRMRGKHRTSVRGGRARAAKLHIGVCEWLMLDKMTVSWLN